MADIQDRCRMPQETLEAPGVVVLPKLLRVGKTYCELCRVWECMNDLIVNVALEALYIHEEGGM